MGNENPRQEEVDCKDVAIVPSAIEKNVPTWVRKMLNSTTTMTTVNQCSYGERIVVKEWESSAYRSSEGWIGADLIHHKDSPVRIIDYFVDYGEGESISGDCGGVGTTLTGIVHFTPRAESHQGHCHGGSMTSVFDDVIGWTGFMVTGCCRPWTGFTVQVNTSLRKPIPVDSWLLVSGVITKVERRKITILAKLSDPANNDTVHAEGDGLVVLNKGVLEK
mmetsp:Transcript_12239/g.18911  ORF Transcript_12239/g.18911 Transcript_12239/m.18911 type:complete len:220 (-) Transcript_12239:32-691(-)